MEVVPVNETLSIAVTGFMRASALQSEVGSLSGIVPVELIIQSHSLLRSPANDVRRRFASDFVHDVMTGIPAG